jgi:hypothetical protein
VFDEVVVGAGDKFYAAVAVLQFGVAGADRLWRRPAHASAEAIRL